MRALVIDTTPLVDLRKASALPLLTRLPFELVTTDFVFGELREFSPDVPIPLWVRLALLPPQLLQRRALAQAQLLVHRREVLRHPAHVPVPDGKPSVQPLAQLLRIRIRRAAASTPATAVRGSNWFTAPAEEPVRAGDLPLRTTALGPHPQCLFDHIHRYPPRGHRKLLPGKGSLPRCAATTRPSLPI